MKKKLVTMTLLGLTATYTAALALLYVRQGKMIFHPSKEHPLRHLFMEKFGARAKEYIIQADCGHPQLKGWKVDSIGETDTIVVYFGGNAENIDSVLFLASNVPEVTMIAMHYRGYGMSDGVPSEEGLFRDALRIIDHVKEVFPEKRVVLFGRSLGSGVALYAAAQRQEVVKHIILTTPFDSITAVVKRHYSWVPVNALLRHRFDSLKNAPSVRANTTLIVAAKDTYIPIEHAKRLSDVLSKHVDVQWHEVATADHSTIHDWNITWKHIRESLGLSIP